MATKTSTKPAEQKNVQTKGYKQHLPGRRKGKVHQLFDKEGAEAAWTLGRRLKLKEGTLRSWFAQWRRTPANQKSKPKGKKVSVAAETSAEMIASDPTVADAVVGVRAAHS